MVLLQDLYMFWVTAVPIIRSTILQLTVTGITYIKLDRGIYGSVQFNTLTLNDLQRRRAVSPLKIKIASKNMREKPINTPIINSVY